MRVQQSQLEDRVASSGVEWESRPPATGMGPERGDMNGPQTGRRDSHTFLKGVLRGSGTLDLLSRFTARDRVEILLYHGLCPGSERNPRFPKLLPVYQFEEHIRTCIRYSRPLSVDQALQPGVSGVVVTFDDGYANNFELAFPILQKYRFPATIFLTSGFLDRSTPLWSDWLEFIIVGAPARNTLFEWRDATVVLKLAERLPRRLVVEEVRRLLCAMPITEIHQFLRALGEHLEVRYDRSTTPDLLRPLTWDEVRSMRSSGLLSFGCHTVSHPVLSRCSAETQRMEILESKRRVEEELGEECTSFAYPYGKSSDYTQVTKQIVADAGIRLALTAESGSTKPSSCQAYEVPRWGADLNVNDLSFLVSGGPLISSCLRPSARRSLAH